MSGMAIGVKLESRLAITEDKTNDVMIKKILPFESSIGSFLKKSSLINKS